MTSPSNCPKCSAELQPGAQFCESCGNQIGEPAPFDAYVQNEHSRAVSKARKWLIALSVLFAVFGTGYGFWAQSQSEDAMNVLDSYPDSEELTVEGDTKTVAEWREAVRLEVYLVFGLNYFLSVVMLGLYFWARKSAFPAMVTALCIYLAVIVLNAAIDPKTLAQGILIKVLFIAAMVSGIKAAMAERDARHY